MIEIIRKVRDVLIELANHPMQHGGMTGLQRIIREQAAQLIRFERGTFQRHDEVSSVETYFDLRPVNTNHRLFEPIWQAIKQWDIGRDGGRSGYAGANGTDVQIILDSIDTHGAGAAVEAVEKWGQQYRCGCFLGFPTKRAIPASCPQHMRDKQGGALPLSATQPAGAQQRSEQSVEAVAWTVFDAKGVRFTLYNRELAEAIAERGLLVLPMLGCYEWYDAKVDTWKPINRLPYTWERELGIEWRQRETGAALSTQPLPQPAGVSNGVRVDDDSVLADNYRWLRCGGWEVLQDPKYWLPDNRFDGAVAAARADVSLSAALHPDQAKDGEAT